MKHTAKEVRGWPGLLEESEKVRREVEADRDDWRRIANRLRRELDEQRARADRRQAGGHNPKSASGRLKPDLSLIPPAAAIHEARAFEEGAQKYGPFQWRESTVEARTYIAAALRHINAWVDGEELAPDSGQHHLGHARASLGILLDAQECGTLDDNRPPPGAAARLQQARESGQAFRG